jgi:hypothetical protein
MRDEADVRPVGSTTAIPLADALRMAEMAIDAFFGNWKFCFTLSSAMFGGVIFQFKEITSLDLGVRVALCLGAWFVLGAVWGACGRTKKRLHATFELIQLSLAHATPRERELVATMTRKLIMSEHIILALALLLSMIIFWPELTASLRG